MPQLTEATDTESRADGSNAHPFIGLNLGLENIDISEFGDQIKSGATILFDESAEKSLSVRYFGIEANEPQSTDTVIYGNGSYSVPDLNGTMAYPVVQLLVKDTANEACYYAIVDYMLETPVEEIHLEYQRLTTLQKLNDAYVITAIKNVRTPIDFELLNSVM